MNKLIKNILSFVVAIFCAFSCVALAACGADPKDSPASSYYYVTFDEDNNSATQNVTKNILKSQINNPDQYPALAANADNGFSGEWVLSKENGDNLTFIASYGDGSELKPFLISTPSEIQKIVTDYQSSTVYARLIKDIDMNNLPVYTSTGTNSIVLDGTKTDFKGNAAGKFVITLHSQKPIYLFNYLENSAFKNFDIVLGQKGSAISSVANAGEVLFENITVNSSRDFVTIDADNYNYSPFISYALGTSHVKFKNCTNNANFMSTAKSLAIFLGGYGTLETTLTFDGCVNNGNITTIDAAGVFIGNRTYNPTINITNCKNTGNFASKMESHVLAGNIPVGSAANVMIPVSSLSSYDTSIDGVIENTGTFTVMTSNAQMSANDGDIVVSSTNGTLTAGTYQFNIRTYFKNSAGRTLYLTLKKTLIVEGTENSITFENVDYDFCDFKTFLERVDMNASDIQVSWTYHGEYRYFIDAESGEYIIDMGATDWRKDGAHTTGAIVKTVVVYDSTGAIVNII